MHERVRVPVSSHTLVNPPHVLHMPQLVAMHIVPSVSREQPRLSVRVDESQLPLAHA